MTGHSFNQTTRVQLHKRGLTLKDIHLRVNVPKNTTVQRDVNCDSQFMLDSMQEIGTSIRDAYSFLPQSTPIYLFMDNAGGHGKNDCKEQYVEYLKEHFNIIIEWQVPHSPETNLLDLGVWMATQSHTEYLHKRKVMQADSLADSVTAAYEEINGNILESVHKRWKLVLELIIAGKGSNNLVESARGLKVNLASLPQVSDLDSDDDDVVRDLIKKAEDEHDATSTINTSITDAETGACRHE